MTQRKQAAPGLGAQVVFALAFLVLLGGFGFLYVANKREAATQALAPPKLTSFVDDGAGALSRDVSLPLEETLRAFDRLGGPQLVVATRRDIDRPIEEEALRLARGWKIGRAGADNGVLLLIVTTEGRARIEVGYGLEATLPDATARLILANAVDPALATGDVDGAAQRGAQAILAVLHPDPIPPLRPRQSALPDWLASGVFYVLAALVVLGAFQYVALRIPGVRKRIERSPGLRWLAMWRVIGGGGGGGGGDGGGGGGAGSVGGGGRSAAAARTADGR